MDYANPLSTARSQVTLLLQASAAHSGRPGVWPPGVEDFVRRLYKLGIQIAVVGPRWDLKVGTRKHIRFFDRHEAVALKKLVRAKDQYLELRIMSRKLKAWTRLRTDVCVVSGSEGLWPAAMPGWSSPGVLSLQALQRFLGEYQWVPGHRFMILGSTNLNMSWASRLLEKGAEVHVVEPEAKLQCWRSHRDQVLQKAGKIYEGHSVVKIQNGPWGVTAVYLKNSHGTLVLDVDTVVISTINQETISDGEIGREGLYYIQRKDDLNTDLESQWFSKLDWQEAFWKIAKQLGICDHGEASGAVDRLREERKHILNYRKRNSASAIELFFNGKSLSKQSIDIMKATGSVPREPDEKRPLASLECLESTPCQSCVDACPHGAISKPRIIALPQLDANACTGCGLCVAVCPAGAALMVKLSQDGQTMKYYLPDSSADLWKGGEPLQLLNRRGETLVSAKAVAATVYEQGLQRVLEVEGPSYVMWDARAFKKVGKSSGLSDDTGTQQESSFLNIQRGWIQFNGARRLCPVGVPVTVALWQMGYRRFEDALFCRDGSCGLCAVMVNGAPALACQTIVKEGQTLEVEGRSPLNDSDCLCKSVKSEDVKRLIVDGVSPALAQESTSFGLGVCRGRWCESRCESPLNKSQRLRPRWSGFEHSPWFEIWQGDILPPKNAPTDN